MYAYLPVCMSVCVCTCVCTCGMYVHASVCMYACVHVCMRVYIVFLYACVCIHVHVCLCMYVCMYTYACMYVLLSAPWNPINLYPVNSLTNFHFSNIFSFVLKIHSFILLLTGSESLSLLQKEFNSVLFNFRILLTKSIFHFSFLVTLFSFLFQYFAYNIVIFIFPII